MRQPRSTAIILNIYKNHFNLQWRFKASGGNLQSRELCLQSIQQYVRIYTLIVLLFIKRVYLHSREFTYSFIFLLWLEKLLRMEMLSNYTHLIEFSYNLELLYLHGVRNLRPNLLVRLLSPMIWFHLVYVHTRMIKAATSSDLISILHAGHSFESIKILCVRCSVPSTCSLHQPRHSFCLPIRATIAVAAADYHSWDSRMMLNSDAVVAGQSRCCRLHDIALVRAQDAGPHAPYLPC